MGKTSVWIEPQGASNGAHQWITAAEATKSHWTEGLARAQGMGTPWGDDEAGQAFFGAYAGKDLMENGDIKNDIEHLVRMGHGARTALALSLASDADQAAMVSDILMPGTVPEL